MKEIYRTQLEALVNNLGLQDRVTFTGWIDQQQLHTYYTNARCGIVPSVWPEPIATIGLEFYAMRLPVVAFDAGGMSDWLELLNVMATWLPLKILRRWQRVLTVYYRIRN